MNRTPRFAGAALLAAAGAALGGMNENHTSAPESLHGGGGASSSASYSVRASITPGFGPGTMQAGAYASRTGFWNMLPLVDPPGTAASANVGIAQSLAPNPAAAAKDVVISLTVTNAGPASATSVVVTNALPAGSTYVWSAPGCTPAGSAVICNAASLVAGASAVFKVVVRPAAAGSMTNVASVSATQADPSSADNTSSLTATVNATPPGIPVQRYRLYSPVTLEHHFTTDLNEYTVLGSFVGTWVQEGTVGRVLNNPGAFNGVTAVPYYRLYDTSTAWHHWTTDANEYYTLIQYPNWNAEGVDGWILPTAPTGTLQLFRLNYPFIPGLHHWTVDPVEYTQLITNFGWIGEGGSGFVIQ